jgi:hypothetical protein
MVRRRNAVRLGIPALIVTVLAIVALWRVGAPVSPSEPAGRPGPAGAGGEAPRTGPITTIAGVLIRNAVGRQASLEGVEVRQVTSPRTFWFGPPDGQPAFAVLDPDVRRIGGAEVAAGTPLTLIGLVRPSPPAAEAMRQWQLDEPTARVVEDRGTYLHVTEVRPPRDSPR